MRPTLAGLVMVALLLLCGLATPARALDHGPARKLLNSQGCKACHALEGSGGKLAVSFEEMRAALGQAEIRRQLSNPEHRHGNHTIADFSHLSEQELDALVNFIQPQPKP